MARVTIVQGEGGDWEGVYRDGLLIAQDHTVSLLRAFRGLIGYTVDKVSWREVDQDWLEGELGLPNLLAEIPGEAIR